MKTTTTNNLLAEMRRLGVPTTQPPRDARWVFWARRDQLAHRVLAVAGTQWLTRQGRQVPHFAVTECGRYAVLAESALGGAYLADDALVTCAPCASGLCRNGLLVRVEDKQLLFGTLYGKPPLYGTLFPRKKVP
jgi:hypothetical protein